MYKNQKIYSICPQKFYPIINDAGISSNEKAIKNLNDLLDNLLN
jgi:hypothetical protein